MKDFSLWQTCYKQGSIKELVLTPWLNSDDFTFDYTDTSDKAVSMDVWT